MFLFDDFSSNGFQLLSSVTARVSVADYVVR